MEAPVKAERRFTRRDRLIFARARPAETAQSADPVAEKCDEPHTTDVGGSTPGNLKTCDTLLGRAPQGPSQGQIADDASGFRGTLPDLEAASENPRLLTSIKMATDSLSPELKQMPRGGCLK